MELPVRTLSIGGEERYSHLSFNINPPLLSIPLSSYDGGLQDPSNRTEKRRQCERVKERERERETERGRKREKSEIGRRQRGREERNPK